MEGLSSTPGAFAAPSRTSLQPQDTAAGSGDASQLAGSTAQVLSGFLLWARDSSEVRIC